MASSPGGQILNLRVDSLASGIGGDAVAWHPLGWESAFFSEIEPFASAVLKHRFPDVPNLGDFTAADFCDRARALGEVNVLAAGTPCQAFSVAGKRKSLEDARGNLTLRFVEVVHELDPATVVWEQVPGVLSTKDNAFGCFLAGMVGAAGPLASGLEGGRWPNAGMVIGPRRSLAWRVLDAQYCGLAQRRRRVCVVSFRTRDRTNPGAVLFEPESLRRDSPPSREEGADVTQALTRRLGDGGPDDNKAQGGFYVAFGGNRCGGPLDVATAVNAHGGSGRMDFESETFIAHTLRADGFDASEDGTGWGTPLVAFNARQDPDVSGPIAGALDAGHPQAQACAIPIDMRQASRGDKMTNNRPGGSSGGPAGTGIGEDGDPAPSIAASHTPAVALGSPGAARGVRRLTPRECERLQGFPDDWTLVPYRGRPAEKCADGPRYRALGNAWATPVFRWIGERIEKVLEAHGR